MPVSKQLYYLVMVVPAERFSFKWVMASAFGFGLSLGACRWLFALPRAEYGTLAARIGYVCAFYCAISVGTVCWGIVLAFFGRMRKWSPKTCRLAGLTLFLPLGLVLVEVGHTQLAALLNLWVISGVLAGLVCQKIVYPHATSDELAAPEPPLTLFPK